MTSALGNEAVRTPESRRLGAAIRAIQSARTASATEKALVAGVRANTGAHCVALAEVDRHGGGRIAVHEVSGSGLGTIVPKLARAIALALPAEEPRLVELPDVTWIVVGLRLRTDAALAAGAPPGWAPEHGEAQALQVLAEVAAGAAAALRERDDLQEHLDRTRSLVVAGMQVAEALDLDTTLRQIVQIARDVISARYAALGVLNRAGDGLTNFVWSGMSDEDAAAIGRLPEGRGLLGALIRDPRPLRVDRVAGHPLSVGFPPGHPPMANMMGVPVLVRGEPFGNLYFADKPSPGFTDADVEAATVLAAQAAIAIENARAIRDREERHEAERERLLAEAARDRQTIEIEALTRTVGAQEAERGRISRELHDEAGQVLAALTIRLRRLDDSIRDPEGRAHLEALREAIAQAARRVHNVARDLRPEAIQGGLESALRRQAERLEVEYGTAIDIAVESLPTDLPEEIETTIFRVVQEAVTNVARHSGAASASLVVLGRDDHVRIVVEDDGRGFEPADGTDGLGLAGIRERVALVGGDMRIESRPGGGTALLVNLNLPRRR